jgi:hypothetical protein
MIQLDADRYKIVGRTLEAMQILPTSANRLSTYTHAKEVIVHGCDYPTDPETCSRCSSYIVPMCVAITDAS